MNKSCHVITCDRCGKSHYFESYDNNISRPSGWYVLNDMDLCPECGQLFITLVNDFIQTKNKRTVMLLTAKNKSEALSALDLMMNYIKGRSFDGEIKEKVVVSCEDMYGI